MRKRKDEALRKLFRIPPKICSPDLQNNRLPENLHTPNPVNDVQDFFSLISSVSLRLTAFSRLIEVKVAFATSNT